MVRILPPLLAVAIVYVLTAPLVAQLLAQLAVVAP